MKNRSGYVDLDKEPYMDLGEHYLDNMNKMRTIKNLKKKIEFLGYTVELTPANIVG